MIYHRGSKKLHSCSNVSTLHHHPEYSSHQHSSNHAADDGPRICCTLCTRAFRTRTALQHHQVDVHLRHVGLPHPAVTFNANPVVDDFVASRSPSCSSSDAGSGDDSDSYDSVPRPISGVSCSDCGRKFRTTDALHQHQWDSADHTRVTHTRLRNLASPYRQCSVCNSRFGSANELESHFVRSHPLNLVPEYNEEFTWGHIATRFMARWKKNDVKLHEIQSIYKVYNPGWRRKAFEEYRKSLKRDILKTKPNELGNVGEGDIVHRVLKNGNELERYHGTTVKCELGRNNEGSSNLCHDLDCNLCRILEHGFLKQKCRTHKFQRYGAGIYCTCTSGKANDYVKCSDNESPCKVMIICKVLAGRLYRTTQNIKHLKNPPLGFHSIQGDPGEVLNYDELVVYDDHAILPEYIILYKSEKVTHVSKDENI